MSRLKALAAAGNVEFSVFWSNNPLVDVTVYLTKHPEGHGLWMWEDGVWRRPTNRELGAIFLGENPFDISDQSDKMDVDKWLTLNPIRDR